MVNKLYLSLIITILSLVVLLAYGCNAGPATAKDGDTVKVHYKGALEDDTVFDISEGREPLEFTLGEGKMISGFEQPIYGMQVGQSKTVTIPSEEAYGQHDDELVVVIEKEQLPSDLAPEIGQELKIQTTNGQIISVTIIDVSEETIKIDANYPLAGKHLTFEIELLEIN